MKTWCICLPAHPLRQLRIEPTHPVALDREIFTRKRLILYEVENGPFNNGTQWLHRGWRFFDSCMTSIAADLENGVTIVEQCVDGMQRIPVLDNGRVTLK